MGLVTQQDPIGIAGGLNLYGYANGDPVNHSDPFGLSPCPPDCTANEMAWMALGQAVGMWFGGGSGLALGTTTGPAAVASAYAGAAIGAAAGAAAGLAVGGVIDAGIHMFSRGRSDALKRAEGLERQIEGHIGNIERDPSHPGAGPQAGEVRGWLETITRDLPRMGRKTGRQWQQKLTEWAKRLGDALED